VSVRKGVVLGLAVGGIGILLGPSSIGVRLERDLGLRWLFALRGTVVAPPDVAIVSIDKGSAQQLGLDPAAWPPSRHVHATVIRGLHRHGVSAIVMDVWFPGHRSPEEDDDLARAMAESGKVLLVQRVDRPRVPGAGVTTELLQSPVQQFQESAVGLAPFPLPRGSPTLLCWLFFETSAGVVPTLPAAALEVHALPVLERLQSVLDREDLGHLGESTRPVTSVADSRRLLRVLRGKLAGNPSAARRALARLATMPTGDLLPAERRVLVALLKLYSGRATSFLNFYGPPGSIQTIPFHELLQNGGSAKRDLAGKVVFVGESASSLMTSAVQPDSYPSVYSTAEGVDLSGTEIGATAFANLLTDRTLQPVGPFASFVVLLAFGGLVGALARLLPGIPATASAIAVGCVSVAVAQFLFTAHSLVVPLVVPLLIQLPVALFVGVLSRYRDIRRQTPIEVDPDRRQDVFYGVCLTTDVTGYTRLAEHLSADALHDLLQEYYEMLRTLVAHRHGLVWGRGGDSALCVWKAPTENTAIGRVLSRLLGRERDAGKAGRMNACLAAIEIRDAIDRFNARQAVTSRMPTRIGLDAGEVGLGPVAHELQAVGNPVNAASRIEELNKHLSTSVLASSTVVHGLDALVVRRLGRFVLAGKSEPVEIAEIRGRRDTVAEADVRLCQRFEAGLALFEAMDWPGAVKSFQEMALDHPEDGPSRYFLDLAARYASGAGPPVGGAVISIDPHRSGRAT
jgi:adenylate cyclase